MTALIRLPQGVATVERGFTFHRVRARAWQASKALPRQCRFAHAVRSESRIAGANVSSAATVDDEYVYAPPTTRKAKDGYGTRQELLRFARAFRYAVEVEFIHGGVPPLWLRNGYDNAREITGLDRECWPAPWERES